jgi:hypothetical protein
LYILSGSAIGVKRIKVTIRQIETSRQINGIGG